MFQILYLLNFDSIEFDKIKKFFTKLNFVLDQNENIYELKDRATYFLYGSVIKVEILNDSHLMEELITSCQKSIKNSMLCINIKDEKDTWGYVLYKGSKIYDQFSVNPFPNLDYDLENEFYYEGIDVNKMLEKWSGDKYRLVEILPKINLDSISKYY